MGQKILSEISYLLENFGWLFLQIFIVVAISNILFFIIRKFFRKYEKNNTADSITSIFIISIQKPIKIIIIWTTVFLIFNVLELYLPKGLTTKNQVVFNLGLTTALCWIILSFIRSAKIFFIARYQADDDEFDIDENTIAITTKIIQTTILICVFLIFLNQLGISISGILTFGGIGGLAVGLAARESLSNFFGGLIIFLDKPFKIGNWIRSSEKNIEGIVENIGWRSTIIRTFDNKALFIPNAIFNSIIIENVSLIKCFRVREIIGIRYCDIQVLPNIISDIKIMLAEHFDIDKTRSISVFFTAFAPSSLDIVMYAYCKTQIWLEYKRIKETILIEVANIIEKNNAQIAFPTSTIQLIQEKESSNAVLPSENVNDIK